MDCYIELMTLNNKTRDRLSREEQLGNQGLSSSASFSAELSWEDSCIDIQSWENSYIDLRREHYEIRAELFKLHRLKEETNDAIWVDDPWSTSIVANSGMESVQRSSMTTLQPRTWLKDEIVNYFYLMLAKRDEELCSKTYNKSRSHFFNSFFITNLLNEGSATNDGEYKYQNVKRWSKKAPGKDIFDLDKILLPINVGYMHWISAVIFMQQKRIEIFDSLPILGINGRRYAEFLLRYLQDEHLDKKKTPLPDIKEWKLVPRRETPRQHNGDDCGVFTCIIADLLSIDLPLTFDQSHINQIREYIALSIIRGQATSFVTDASSLLRESTTFADSTLAGCDDDPRDAEARVGPLVGYHYQTPALPGYMSLSLPGYHRSIRFADELGFPLEHVRKVDDAANDVAAAAATQSKKKTVQSKKKPGIKKGTTALRRSTRSASLVATAAITGVKTDEPKIIDVDDYIPDDEMPPSIFTANLIEKIAKRTNALYKDIENFIDDKGVTTSIWDGIKELLTAKMKYDMLDFSCILNNLEGSGDDEKEQYICMIRDHLTCTLAVSVVKGSTSITLTTAEKKKKKKRKRTSSCDKNNHQRRPRRAATQGKKQYSDHDDSKVSSDDDDNDDADTARPKKKQRIQQRTSTGSGDDEEKSDKNNHQRRPRRAATQGKKQYSDHDDSKVSSDDDDNDDDSDHDDSKVSSDDDDDDDDNDDADTARPKKKQRIHKPDTARPKKKQRIHKQVYLDAVNRYLKLKPRPRQTDFLRSSASGQILSDKCKMQFSRYLGLIVAAIKIQTLARVYINRKAFLSLKEEEEKKRNKK